MEALTFMPGDGTPDQTHCRSGSKLVLRALSEDSEKNLRIMDDPLRGVAVYGLDEVVVKDSDDIFRIMRCEASDQLPPYRAVKEILRKHIEQTRQWDEGSGNERPLGAVDADEPDDEED